MGFFPLCFGFQTQIASMFITQKKKPKKGYDFDLIVRKIKSRKTKKERKGKRDAWRNFYQRDNWKVCWSSFTIRDWPKLSIPTQSQVTGLTSFHLFFFFIF